MKENTREIYKDYLNVIYNVRRDSYHQKEVSIITHGVDKNRITLMLAITTGGNKLPYLIVFYGVPNEPKEKEIKNHQLTQKKKLFICCQKECWAFREIFKYWYENILFQYKPEGNEKANKIIIIDRATSHYENQLINILKIIIVNTY